MRTILHMAGTRGHASHGWLESYHTFSFADYFDPGRIHFGALRVLNDDDVTGGMGFGKHPHDNMEIVTIMLEGELRHEDSMGHSEILRKDEVQAMSAGTGIFHSEVNNLHDQPAKLLQIWVFPERRNITPRYEQKAFDPNERKDKWQLLVGPNRPEGALDIKQQSWFSRIDLEKGSQVDYTLHNKDNGVYLFMISGNATVDNDLKLSHRDGAGLSETEKVNIRAEEKSEVLAIEVPMIE
jgi:redox-sensitive bicupin YhaK (pirin superfamily)